MKAAGFPVQKSLDDFDTSQLNPSVSPVFLNELASCQFIEQKKNIVMIGNPGRGKTHIAIALGIKACLQGYHVLFKNASTLSTELMLFSMPPNMFAFGVLHSRPILKRSVLRESITMLPSLMLLKSW